MLTGPPSKWANSAHGVCSEAAEFHAPCPGRQRRRRGGQRAGRTVESGRDPALPMAGPGNGAMRLTVRTGHALRLLTYLAANEGRLATTGGIAERFGISRSHLTRVVWELGRAGFVETVRGRGGGLRLARPAREIAVGAVARHMEGAIPLAECFPGGAGRCRIAPACRYRVVLGEAEEAFFAALDRFTVDDLLADSGKPGARPS